MAIVRNNIRVSRPDGASTSSEDEEEDEEVLRPASTAGDEDPGCGESPSSTSSSSDEDSGMCSDEFNLSDMGEAGTEFCQVGNRSCSIPLELYDLPDLSGVLSVEVWNECLSEEERFTLAELLPDMDQETFSLTLKELFSCANFHFGTPLSNLFCRLKSGLCDPRIVLYRRGMNFFQRREHYYHLRRYQNSMVGSLLRIRSAWVNCDGYGIEERLRLLNILRSKGNLFYDRNGDVDLETDSESRDSSERLWGKRLEMARRLLPPSKVGHGSFGKETKKGFLKVAGPPKVSTKKDHAKAVGQYPVSGKKHDKYAHGLPQQDEVATFDLQTGRRTRNQMTIDDENYGDPDYEDWNASQQDTVTRAGLLKQGKQHGSSKRYGRETPVDIDEDDPKGYSSSSHYYGRSRAVEHEVTIASYDHHYLEAPKKSKYSLKDRMNPLKDRRQLQALKGERVGWSEDDHLLKHKEFRTGKTKVGTDSKVKSHKKFPAQAGDSYFQSDQRANEKLKKCAQLKGTAMEHSRGSLLFTQNKQIDSDSSDEAQEDGGINPLSRKMVCPGGPMEVRQSLVVKSAYEPKKAKKIAKTDNSAYYDGDTGVEPYNVKGKQKGKSNEPSYLHDIRSMKKGQVPDPSGKLQQQQPSLKTCTTERKRKAMADVEHSLQQSNHLNNYVSGVLDENEEDLDWDSKLGDAKKQLGKSGNRNQVSDSHAALAVHHEMTNASLVGCSNATKKRKGKADGMYLDELGESVHQQSGPAKHIDGSDLLKKKGKRKTDTGTGSLPVETTELLVSEKGKIDIEPETKAQKNPFNLITPSIHTDFSFSIIHLLSAVRKAMIAPHTEDTIGASNHLKKDDARMKPRREDQGRMFQAAGGRDLFLSLENADASTSEHAGQNDLPSLTVQEIINRVRSNPGDPCILETQEPLQDLLRGVLKIFASKAAPLGAKGWKVLVFYEKSNRSWTWVGPVSSSSSDIDAAEEDISAEAWGIPHKMLVKLVDAFANWLKSGQKTLQQIGSLPAPPITVLPNLDEKERFKDLRAQKSLNTFTPSSEEMKAYFRKEEHLRYSVPDRAFSYTAYDGKKSIVAPLRRGGGKPTSKARDHFMLKPNRPPHVTILCLVRDAAARLPGNIGTRADVCTLIRDSQYVVEDVSDAQVNGVVSGALDRLHYERDPCVQFDGDRKLWVYLHRDREEEDFEDDGTSSTKKWKRPRKDPTERTEMGPGNDASYNGTGDSAAAGYELDCELIDSPTVHVGEQAELIYNGLRSNMENIQSYIDSAQGGRGQWDSLGLNSFQENKMLCQENSRNEDFDDEAFSRDRPVGFLSASLL